MTEKLECSCIEAYKTRNMRDPNCCACSCDHNELVKQLAKANERYGLLRIGVVRAIGAIEREDDSSAYDAITYLENALKPRKEQNNDWSI